MSLECRGITKSFGGVRALDDVSISFPDQGTVAIIGPNGAGKTTLIDSLTGVIPPDRGEWFLDGQNVTGLATEKMVHKGVARSFQGVRLLPGHSVLDNIVLAFPMPGEETILAALRQVRTGRHPREVLEKVRSMAEELDLASRVHDPVHSLSFGEQKLASILATAATGARTLLFDEPIAGVHGDGVERIIAFTRVLAERGHLIIFVEHDMAAVRRLADNVIVLAEGRVLIELNPTDEVLLRRDLLEAYLG
jgi:ABC-type branched-subunit amino acid transport system ATPase component